VFLYSCKHTPISSRLVLLLLESELSAGERDDYTATLVFTSFWVFDFALLLFLETASSIQKVASRRTTSTTKNKSTIAY
jgi:hypothetical protein